MHLNKAFLISVILGLSTPVFADQNYTIKPNGKITFKVSTSSVTRVRFASDRVLELVSSGDAFEHKNNANSGDVFLKLAEGADAQVEEGYFITEKGVTIRFKMVPTKRSVEDVVIKVKGSVENDNSTVSNRAVSSRTSSRGLAGASGYKSGLIEIVKSVIINDLPKLKKRAGSRKSVTVGGRRVDIIVVSGGKSGKQIAERDFAKKGVVGVWVEKPFLNAGETAWMMVVR